MKKIFIEFNEERALLKSIKHWEIDIIKYLEKGWTIYSANGFLNWIKPGKICISKKEVQCFAKDCALCVLENHNCEECIYNRYYGLSCQDELYDNKNKKGHWIKFKDNPCLRTAKAMRNSLERILNNKKEEK